jgi:predicted dehydrogenase
MPQPKLGVALVGLGTLSTNQIAPALQRTEHCRLAGIVTGTPSKAARWQSQYGIPDRSVYRYETMARLAENPDIDIVYVVTPNALHGDHTIAAARAGKHVLCEKPMEVSTERCEAMIAACQAAGRQLAIAYRCQFEPHHLACVRLARQQELGPVRLVDACFGFPIGDPAQWRLRKALAGGGPMFDVGIYCLQTARMISGEEPISVSALESKTDPATFREVEETMTFQLAFPGGVLANCSTSYVTRMNEFTVHAARGSFGMRPAYDYTGNRGFRSDGGPLALPAIDSIAAELDDFARCITTGAPSRVPGEEGSRDVRILLAAFESARSGRVVALG